MTHHQSGHVDVGSRHPSSHSNGLTFDVIRFVPADPFRLRMMCSCVIALLRYLSPVELQRTIVLIIADHYQISNYAINGPCHHVRRLVFTNGTFTTSPHYFMTFDNYSASACAFEHNDMCPQFYKLRNVSGFSPTFSDANFRREFNFISFSTLSSTLRFPQCL